MSDFVSPIDACIQLFVSVWTDGCLFRGLWSISISLSRWPPCSSFDIGTFLLIDSCAFHVPRGNFSDADIGLHEQVAWCNCSALGPSFRTFMQLSRWFCCVAGLKSMDVAQCHCLQMRKTKAQRGEWLTRSYSSWVGGAETVALSPDFQAWVSCCSSFTALAAESHARENGQSGQWFLPLGIPVSPFRGSIGSKLLHSPYALPSDWVVSGNSTKDTIYLFHSHSLISV